MSNFCNKIITGFRSIGVKIPVFPLSLLVTVTTVLCYRAACDVLHHLKLMVQTLDEVVKCFVDRCLWQVISDLLQCSVLVSREMVLCFGWSMWNELHLTRDSQVCLSFYYVLCWTVTHSTTHTTLWTCSHLTMNIMAALGPDTGRQTDLAARSNDDVTLVHWVHQQRDKQTQRDRLLDRRTDGRRDRPCC